MTEVSCLYQNLCSPREGHLDSIYPIFRYLNKNLGKNPGRMAYDPMYEPTDENVFKVLGRSLDEWKDFYPDDQEMTTRHMPEEIGKYVLIKAYVDAKHTGNMADRRYHSGIIIYFNNVPIIWYSKLHNTVEASSFGSEFFSLRIPKNIIEALRYKLRCFGITVEGPTEVFFDNMSVDNSIILTCALTIGIMLSITTG